MPCNINVASTTFVRKLIIKNRGERMMDFIFMLVTQQYWEAARRKLRLIAQDIVQQVAPVLTCWRTGQVSLTPGLIRAARAGLDDGYLVVTGSIESPERIAAIAGAGADAFTIGTAVFNNALASGGETITYQCQEILKACGSTA
jgi:hypothetical protein